MNFTRAENKIPIKFFLSFLLFLSLNSISHAAQLATVSKTHHLPSHLNSQPKPIKPLQNKPFQIAQHHILVKLKKGVSATQFLTHAKNKGLMKLGKIYHSDWYIMSIPVKQKPSEAILVAKGVPGVLNATPDPIIHLASPNDPFYLDDDDPSTKPCDIFLEYCDPYAFVDQWGLFKVGAQAAWDLETGSSSVTIAIIDSGIDLDHDDLFANIWTNAGEIASDGIDNDGNGVIDDVNGADFVGVGIGDPSSDPSPPNIFAIDGNPDIPASGEWVEDLSLPCYTDNDIIFYGYGLRFNGDPAVGDACDNNLDYAIDAGVAHGTMVAGIAAAMTDNINPETSAYEGMAGVCWNCKLMGVRMINAEGWGLGSSASSAIIYAAEMGANVINTSWGFDTSGPDPDGEVAAITDAIDYAAGQGAIVVAAAGNGSGTPVLFPASLPNTIAVGSSDWTDHVSAFSSTMTMTQLSNQVLDIVAPGELIWSTCVYSAIDELVYNIFLADPTITAGLDTYCQANGTSFSAPLVSGYIGLLLSHDPSLALSDIRTILHDNAVDIEDPGYDNLSGHGRLQMIIPDTLSPAPNDPPTAAFDYTANALSVEFANTSTDSDGSIDNWEWDFGDGSIHSFTQNPAHTYANAGSYNVELKVTDSNGAIDTVLQNISVSENTAPISSFSFQCNRLACAFASTAWGGGSEITTYNWDFGDASGSSSAESPTYSYAKAGNYSVTLTVENAGGLDSVSSVISVKKRGSTEGSTEISPPNPPSGGDSNNMYLWDITMSKKGKSLNVSVIVHRDSNGDGIADDIDAPVDNAYIEGWLCPLPNGTCSFVGNQSITDANGKANWKLLGATAANYSFEVKSIIRDPYIWNFNMNYVSNPFYSNN